MILPRRTFRWIGGAAALGIAVWLVLLLTGKSERYYIDDARKLLAQGDIPGAVIELRNASRLDAKNAKLHLELAGLYLKLLDPPAAEAEARLARDTGATDDEVTPLLGQAMLVGGRFSELLRQVKPGDRPPKVESEVRLVIANAYLALREDRNADPLLKDAERLDPDGVGPRIGVVRLHLLQNDIPGAEAALARARALAQNDSAIARLDAEILERKGDHAGARAGLDAILDKRPDDLDALALRAAIRIDDNQLDAAAADVAHALELNPDLIVAQYLDAVLAFRNGDLASADEKLLAITEFLGTIPEGFYLQGVVKARLGRYPAAVESLSKYMAARPNDPRGAWLLASLALRQGDAARAIEIVRPVLAADPGDAIAAITVARAYLAKNDPDTALAYYDRAATAVLAHPQAATKSARLMPIQGNDWLAKEIDALSPIEPNGAFEAPVRALADLRSGAVTRAGTEAEALIKLDPKDVLARDWLGIVRTRQKNYAEAERIFADLSTRDLAFVDPQRNLARLYMETHRPDLARKAWEAVLSHDTVDLTAFLGLAEIAVQAKDTAAAVEWLGMAQRSSPNDPSPGKALVKLYASQRDWANADKAGRDLLLLFPTDPDLVEMVAQARADSGDVAGARALFQQRIALLPKPFALLERQGDLLARIGDTDGARASFLKAAALAPGSNGIWQALVNLDYETRGVDAALETARAFAEIQPVASAWQVADVLVRARRLPEAIESLVAAQQRHPAPALVFRIAQLEAMAGDRARGEALMETWIKDHPDDSMVGLELAEFYAAEGKSDDAASAYEHALMQAPNNPVALNNLAWIYLRKSDPRAHDAAERAYNLAPSPQTADTLGWSLVRAGDAPAGLPFLRDAGSAAPDEPAIQYHLAAALKATGETQAARQVLERILKPDAAFEGAEDARRLFAELRSG